MLISQSAVKEASQNAQHETTHIFSPDVREKIELAVANCLPSKMTYGIKAKNSWWPDVSILAEFLVFKG